MPLLGFLGPVSETHITNNSAYPVFANVKMLSKIDVFLTAEGNFSVDAPTSSPVNVRVEVGKKDLKVPPGFSKIMPGQTQKFCPEGGGRRILGVGTAYLSIYIQKPEGEWDQCCENHPFKENRSFNVNADLSFSQINYKEDFRMHS